MFVYQVYHSQTGMCHTKNYDCECLAKLIALEINKYIVQKHMYTVHTVHNYIIYRSVCPLVV
jgi:hypothetical protein